MKKNRRRYESREAILAQIEETQSQLKTARKLGWDFRMEADELREKLGKMDQNNLTEKQRGDYHGMAGRLKICREEQGAKERAVPRLENALRNLGQTLAQFDTQPMPFLADSSVQA